MMIRCKRDYTIGNAFQNATYFKDEWYEYYVEIHEETGTKLYYVDGQPLLEGTFKCTFDDIQYVRKEKINKILYE